MANDDPILAEMLAESINLLVELEGFLAEPDRHHFVCASSLGLAS